MCKVVDKLRNDSARGTLVIPEWQSSPFWPKLYKNHGFKPFVQDYMILPNNHVTHKGRGQNGIFGKKYLGFNFIALKLAF